MKRSHLRKPIWAATLFVFAAAALALAACGDDSDTAPTDLPTRTTPVAAVTFPADQQPQQHESPSGSTGGLQFVPWVDIEVSALGYYDHGQDGLRNDHEVVIYDSYKKAVTPTAIVGDASDLDGLFRYEPIEPVVLKAGRNYVLAFHSAMSGDPGTDPEGVVWAPEIRFVRWQEHDDGWAYPAGTWVFMDLSGNFKFMPVPASSPTP